MSTKLESFVPVVKFHGLNTDKATVLGSTLSVAGAVSLAGAVTFTGAIVDNTEVVTATNVITAAESGKTFFLDAAAGFESTLPTAAAGLHLRFIVKTAPTSNGYTITGAPADKIYGTVACSGAEATINGVTASAADNVILVHNQAAIGDLVEFFSDGTNWYVTGNVNTYAAITANG
jgi:hypothetical protein